MKRRKLFHHRRWTWLTLTVFLAFLPGPCINDILRLATPFLI